MAKKDKKIAQTYNILDVPSISDTVSSPIPVIDENIKRILNSSNYITKKQREDIWNQIIDLCNVIQMEQLSNIQTKQSVARMWVRKNEKEMADQTHQIQEEVEQTGLTSSHEENLAWLKQHNRLATPEEEKQMDILYNYKEEVEQTGLTSSHEENLAWLKQHNRLATPEEEKQMDTLYDYREEE